MQHFRTVFPFPDVHEAGAELARVQALRATPPALAQRTGRRRKVFGAALEQFAQLLDASSRVGPATSPLTLFYALAQGGRAIAAAHCSGPGNRYEFRGHGLKIVEEPAVGDTAVVPAPYDDRGDAISVVADSTASQP